MFCGLLGGCKHVKSPKPIGLACSFPSSENFAQNKRKQKHRHAKKASCILAHYSPFHRQVLAEKSLRSYEIFIIT